MVQSQIPAVAKFFFLTTQNSDKTHDAIYRTIMRLNKIYKNDPAKEEDASLLVYWTYHYWKLLKKKKALLSFLKKKKAENNVRFVIPQNLDMILWQQYLSEAKDEEALFLVWSCVLNISDFHIAKGMALSDGTVRFRLGNALKKMGRVVGD